MKRIITLLIVGCLWLLVAASTCFAQMYTVTDLGTLSSPKGINLVGQVVGDLNGHAFLWTKSNGFQDLGTLAGGTFSHAAAINDLGTVTGTADGAGKAIWVREPPFGWSDQECDNLTQPFVWTETNGMQGLGVVAPPGYEAYVSFPPIGLCTLRFYGAAINDRDQVVGDVGIYANYEWGFLWTRTNGMAVFGGSWPPTFINGISNTGQIVGQNAQYGTPSTIFLGHATSWKEITTWYSGATDLGTLGGAEDLGYPYGYSSSANGVNDVGQIVGWSTITPIPQWWYGWAGDSPIHALLWSSSGEMRDLGTLPGDAFSAASRINFFGQVIGSSGNAAVIGSSDDRHPGVVGRPFIWSESSEMRDLNTLIHPDSGWVLTSASDINGWGQIVGEGTLNGQPHGFLLTPIYKALVQQPINADDSSVFRATRGVVPVKFRLTQYDSPTCGLLPATIGITRTAGGTVGAIDESAYSMAADSGSNFRISGCQYIYNLAASALGVGTYRVDISIDGIFVGHAVFALK